MQNSIVFLKLGGSLITKKDEPFRENADVIKKLAKEIHEAREGGNFRLVVGNGGGSYPHVPAKKYRTKEGVVNEQSYKGIAEVQDAASRLNRIVVRSLLDHGENAVSISPSSACFTKSSKIIEFYTKPLKMLLDSNMVPVVYGDVVLDEARGCSILSTEDIFARLAREIKPDRIVCAGMVDGVFDSNPLENPDAKLVPEITPENYPRVRKSLGGGMGIDVTGGMLHKIDRCMEFAEMGIRSYIVNGMAEHRVRDALKGTEVAGTIVHR